MTIVYVTTGAWGAGTGTPNSAAQVDGNFYDLDQRIVGLNADLAEGKRIDHVTYTSISMTFHYTDGSTQVIPLPVYTLSYVGPWMNTMPLVPGQLFTAGNGFYQVLEAHTTPASPAPFDPNATDGSTAGDPLYALWMPLRDVNYDAAIFVPGAAQRAPDELLFVGIANRTMELGAGDERAYAYLDVGNDSTDASDIILSIEKNHAEIGTITFAAGGEIDTDGGQVGAFNIPALTSFAEGDTYGLRVTASDNAEPSGAVGYSAVRANGYLMLPDLETWREWHPENSLLWQALPPGGGESGGIGLDLTQRVVNVKWGDELAVEFAKGDG